jgi:cysteine desulfurase
MDPMSAPPSAPTDVYLDNAATTRTDPDLAERMARDMVDLYANPSSAHRPGLAAARRLAEARREVEALFPERQAVFTASGSEAIALALRGGFARRRRGADRVLVSAVEHPAVLKTAADLAAGAGARVETLPVDGEGVLDLEALSAALARADDVALVAVMHVQNELGSVAPLEEAGRRIRAAARRALFLVDAVQGLGKLPVDPILWDADAVAIASHKIHGPKGMGALLIRKGLPLAPQVAGGGQEGGYRSGTENVAGIAAFALACVRAVRGLPANAARMGALRERLRAALLARVEGAVENSPRDPARGTPAILNVSFPEVPSEVLLHALEEDGVYVSAGSACHSKGKPANHVHDAVRMPEARRRSAIRFGLSRHTTEAEVDRAVEAVVARVSALRRGAAVGAAR